VKPCPYPNAAELSSAGQPLRQCSGQAWAAVPTQSGGTGETPVLHRIVGTQVWRARLGWDGSPKYRNNGEIQAKV